MPKTAVEKRDGKILIADDEKNMRETLAAILADEGYDVDVAASGEEAVEMTRRNGYSVVLMDVRMPGIDGVEAFRQIRRHREGVRVILMSAYGVDEVRRAALDEGAVAFLAKPIDVDRLIRLVGEVHDTAILVVGDDDGTIGTLQTTLRQRGYRVTVRRSPQDALELVEQIRFDLIFVDVNLPAMNGLDFYLAVKRITPSAVAIMIAGREAEFEQIAREAVRRSAYTFVRKPLDVDHILGLLARINGGQASNDMRKPGGESH